MEFIKSREDIITNAKEGLGIVACYVNPRDSVHVGLYWNWQGDQEIIHFRRHNDIEIDDISQPKFERYRFSSLDDFPALLIDSLIAVTELISENKINNLRLDLRSVIYNGGKFEISSGNFIVEQGPECFINCGVFVMALLETYNYRLLDWGTWPPVTLLNRSNYLESWLADMNVQEKDKDQYYNFNKEIRGRHIIACSKYGNKATKYSVAEPLSQECMDFLRH